MRGRVVVVFLVLVLVSVFCHEFVHYTIFRYYDCEDVELVFRFDGLMSGVGVSGSCESGSDAWLAHSVNEVVTYNFMPLLVFLIVVLVDFKYSVEEACRR